ISSARTSDMGMSYSASVNGGATTAVLATGDLTINGAAIKASVAGSGKGQGADSAYAIAKAINESQSEVVAKANTTTATASAAITATAADFAINGVTIGASTSQAELLEKINANSAATGVSAATDASGFVKLSAADGRNIDITGAAPTGGTLVSAKSTLTLTANSGSTQGSGIVIAGAGVAKAGLTAGTTAAALTGTAISKIDISTAAGADDALKSLDAALGQINSERASLGAIQNRFDSVVSNLQTNAENLTASKSRIMDTDFAAETANLTRAQILQQAGTAMLAQANQLPQNVLSLLR
ncbi:MAG: flagellin, partial [Burkholderiaceae bacterium]